MRNANGTHQKPNPWPHLFSRCGIIVKPLEQPRPLKRRDRRSLSIRTVAETTIYYCTRRRSANPMADELSPARPRLRTIPKNVPRRFGHPVTRRQGPAAGVGNPPGMIKIKLLGGDSIRRPNLIVGESVIIATEKMQQIELGVIELAMYLSGGSRRLRQCGEKYVQWIQPTTSRPLNGDPRT